MNILEKFYSEKKDWFKYIYKRLNFGVKGHFTGAEDAAEDIFDESLTILKEKYIDTGKLKEDEHAKATLVNIIRLEVFRYLRIDMDARWRRQHPEQSETGIPPSTVLSRAYSKKYAEAHKEQIKVKQAGYRKQRKEAKSLTSSQ